MDINSSTVLILAAGKSSRMGKPKGLVTYHDRPWLLKQFEWIKDRGLQKVILVLGHQSENYFQEIPWLRKSVNSWTEHNNLQVKTIINQQPERGSFSSLQVTIAFLLKLSQTDGVFLLPVDVPCPSSCVWKQLLPSELLASPSASIPQYKNQGGHPVFLNRAFLKKLGALPFDSRLDQQIGALENKTRILTDDSRVGLNLNTPEDWKSFSGLTQL